MWEKIYSKGGWFPVWFLKCEEWNTWNIYQEENSLVKYGKSIFYNEILCVAEYYVATEIDSEDLYTLFSTFKM